MHHLCTWSRSVPSLKMTWGRVRLFARLQPPSPCWTDACSSACCGSCADVRVDCGFHFDRGYSGHVVSSRGCCVDGCHVSWSVSLSAGAWPPVCPSRLGSLGTPHRAVNQPVNQFINQLVRERTNHLNIRHSFIRHKHAQVVPEQVRMWSVIVLSLWHPGREESSLKIDGTTCWPKQLQWKRKHGPCL